YRRLGGLEGAIAERAEEVCAELPASAGAAVLRELVTLRQDQDEASARPALRAEAATTPEREQVVDLLVAARLVVSTGTPAGPVLRLAHEALIRHWPRLRDLIAADREFFRTRTRLQQDRDRWEAEGRPVDLLLPHGKRLAEGAELLATRGDDLDPGTAGFIAASVTRDRVLSRRQLRRTQIFAGTVAVLALAAIGFGGAAELQRVKAARSLVQAQQGLARAKGQEGYLALSQGRYDDALAAFRMALQIRETLVRNGLKEPIEQRNIGVNRRDVANSLRAKGDMPGAIAEYRSSRAQFEKLLAGKPGDELLRDDIAIDDIGLGELLTLQKDFDAARTEYAAGIEVLKALVADDPDKIDWPNNLSGAHYDLGMLLLRQGDAAGAAEQFTASQGLRRALCDKFPQSPVFKVRLLYADYQLGTARRRQGELDAALAAFTAAEGLAAQVKDGLSAGDMGRVEQAVKETRDDIAARGAPAKQ
ncbi:MAG TPA: tetratricopeptide repeat protein, partial [Stellaceae bacterium]|nr:tetratricopeptide repeat protein [Stellaceae bacterium]